MAETMNSGTARQMLPFGAAGAVVTLILYQSAPASLWILPGLWQILIALIDFTSLASLPRSMAWAAGWYFLCGRAVLDMLSRGAALSPWMMGVPFAMGQAAVALLLHRSGRNHRG